jgi:zinc D-Ala-D-Ala dipeptidase
VDVNFVDREGNEVEMPSAFDDFSSRAWPNNFAMSKAVRKNVTLLRQVMMRNGFTPLEHEWWHFDDRSWRNFPLVDVSLENF